MIHLLCMDFLSLCSCEALAFITQVLNNKLSFWLICMINTYWRKVFPRLIMHKVQGILDYFFLIAQKSTYFYWFWNKAFFSILGICSGANNRFNPYFLCLPPFNFFFFPPDVLHFSVSSVLVSLLIKRTDDNF